VPPGPVTTPSLGSTVNSGDTFVSIANHCPLADQTASATCTAAHNDQYGSSLANTRRRRQQPGLVPRCCSAGEHTVAVGNLAVKNAGKQAVDGPRHIDQKDIKPSSSSTWRGRVQLMLRRMPREIGTGLSKSGNDSFNGWADIRGVSS